MANAQARDKCVTHMQQCAAGCSAPDCCRHTIAVAALASNGHRQTVIAQLSSPGLTGRPSIPEAPVINLEAAAYWITRSSRVRTAVGPVAAHSYAPFLA